MSELSKLIKIYRRGATYWYNENHELHREDGPAIEYDDGTKCWVLNGKLHRLDGPAAAHSDGSQEWYKNGEPHREDGPARDFNFDNSKEWWVDGKRHREDGPAIERANGIKEWWFNGKRININELIARASNPNYQPTKFEITILEHLIKNE